MLEKVKTWLENIDDSDYRYKTIQDEIEKHNELEDNIVIVTYIEFCL